MAHGSGGQVVMAHGSEDQLLMVHSLLLSKVHRLNGSQ